MKRSLSRILLLVFLCLLVSPIARTQRLLGNESTALSFNQKGQLESLHWPGPGGAEQLHRGGTAFFASLTESFLPKEGQLHGAQWGIGVEGKIDWQEHNSNGVVWDLSHIPAVSRSTTSNESVYTQSSLMLSSANVLAMQLNLLGSDDSPAFYWFQDFNPTLAQPAAWAGATELFSHARDFAAFFVEESKTLYHFRPKQPSSEDREQARAKHWEEFGEGVWIGTVSAEPITAYRCVEMPIDIQMMELPYKNSDSVSAYGDVATILQIEPRRTQSTLSASLYIAIGESKDKVDESLAAVRSLNFDALAQQEKAAWDARLDGLLPEGDFESMKRSLLEEAVAFLFSARDVVSGAIVHAPLPGGPAYSLNASVWPGDVAWITEALLTLKMQDKAVRHLDFCLHAVNEHSSPERPAGSLPFALYTDGRPAAPPCIADTEASAQTLVAVWRFARSLDAAKQVDYFLHTRASIDLLGQFLAQQFNNAEESVSPSFQSQELRDAHSHGTLAMVYLGLIAAKEIMTMQGAEFPPEWARSVKVCESQIRFAILNETSPWPLSTSAIRWMEQLLPQDHPLWKAPIANSATVQTLAQLRPAQMDFLEGGQIIDSLQAARVIVGIIGE